MEDIRTKFPASTLVSAYCHDGLSSLLNHKQNKSFLLLAVLVIVFYHGNRKVNNTEVSNRSRVFL